MPEQIPNNLSHFWGRQRELTMLENEYDRDTARLIAIYGRRRIGKSTLIGAFVKNKPHLYFEGLEGERTPAQIAHFQTQLKEQAGDMLLSDMSFKSWDAIFSYFTSKALTQKKQIIVFDELQWMAAGRTKLISLLKYYWDNKWKAQGITLILCGSIASFMVKKVLKSKALYGRINLELHLTPLKPAESAKFLSNRSTEEILHYLLLLGGIPKYLEEINTRQSFEKNINRLCFSEQGALFAEFERIFFGQFSDANSYLSIIKSISSTPKTLNEIAKVTKIESGGGLKGLINNLEQADFIRELRKCGGRETSKDKKYAISDEYLTFYIKYLKPNIRTIKEQASDNLFQRLVKPDWVPWLGLAFERFCLKHSSYLAQLLGFANELEDSGPFFERSKPGFQIDLLFQRSDKVIVISEIKYRTKEIDTEIIPEFENKLALYTPPRGYSVEKALISTYGPSVSLKKSKYFNYYLSMEEILRGTKN
jgi:hypothetical protein